MLKNRSNLMKLAVLGMVLVSLPACEWPTFLCWKKRPKKISVSKFAAGVKGGAVLAEVNGKPVITEVAFNEKLKQMLQANAYTKDIDPATVPAEAKIKFLNDWLSVVMIKEVWGGSVKIRESNEFKVALSERIEALEDALIVEKFVASLKDDISIDDGDVKKEFNKNKDRYTKVAGGVRIAGAKFSDKELAKEFAESVRSKVKTVADFETAVKQKKDARFRDFGRVSETAFRGAPEELAKKALSTKRFPTVDLVEIGDDEFWSLFCLDKKDAEYYSLDEVKPQIKVMLEEKAFGETLNAKLEGFREEAAVKVNETFFKK